MAKRPKPTVAHARMVWATNGKPSTRELAKLLRAQGYDISDSTISRWWRADPTWAAAQALAEGPTLARVIAALEEAKNESVTLTAEVYSGVKARLIARIYEIVKTIEIANPDDLHRLIDAAQRMDEFIHDERGKAVALMAPVNPPGEAPPGIMARYNPSITLPAFKKANGGGH